MPHKITLTGKPTSSLRVKKNYCTFDMEEKGSPGPPKGLPKSSAISYTVFVNQKQLKKAGLTSETIETQKLLIQGEPTLDIPIEDCPGEIAVVCFQISVIEEKEKEIPKQEAISHKEIPKEEKPLPKAPEGTEDFINLEEIIVPEEFLNSRPNPEKTQQVIEYVNENGHLDEPIEINKETKILVDGYRRYIVAREMTMPLVPIVYEKLT